MSYALKFKYPSWMDNGLDINVQFTTSLLYVGNVDRTYVQLLQYKTVIWVVSVLCYIIKNRSDMLASHYNCPFDHFIMLYQLLKMCGTAGINWDVSVYFAVQSWCLFWRMVVNHRDGLLCSVSWAWINLTYNTNKNTYSVCPWNTDTEWIGSRKSHRRNVVSRDDVTTRRWVGWDEVCVSSWSWPVWRIEATPYLQLPQWIACGSLEHRAFTTAMQNTVHLACLTAVQDCAIWCSQLQSILRLWSCGVWYCILCSTGTNTLEWLAASIFKVDVGSNCDLPNYTVSHHTDL
jgi:hypothetical protein